ncbi:MAG TPA: guanylate kinase [Syntrophomonadaceae bacterium]|nr:guanylate kinase [Syntrophomonadaceae bacterium]
MNRKGILFVISGPSGVGKGTVREGLMEKVRNIKNSVSATTRPPRIGEVDGQDYFFISKEKFEKLVEQDEFLEWAHVYSNMYGTPEKFVQQVLDKGIDVLLEIDIQGALQVKKKRPDGVFIFLAPPNIEELTYRLIARGKDSQGSIEQRVKASRAEMSYIDRYDYLVINDDIEDAIKNIESIIIAERSKIKNIKYEVNVNDSSID